MEKKMEKNRKTMMERYVRHLFPNAVFGSFYETMYGATKLNFWVDDEFYVCVDINGMVAIWKGK